MDPVLTVRFYRLPVGNEPVREWLLALSREARRAIGEYIKTVQYGWPLGMPLVRKIEARLWEVRSHLPSGIARVFFTTIGSQLVLLHGFVKKSQATPADELQMARRREREVTRGQEKSIQARAWLELR